MIVYADFSSPECLLAAHRADVLEAAGVRVDWRAVEGIRSLPIGGRRLTSAEQDALADRLASLGGELLAGESLPYRLPSFVPRTEAAIAAYAEAYPIGVAMDVRRLLFDLYWRAAADIGSPTVLRTPLAGAILRGTSVASALREAGSAVSVDRGPVTTDAYHRIHAWRAEWSGLSAPELPVLLVDGAVLIGIDALRRLGKEIAYRNVAVVPVLPDPSRYPECAVRPDRNWVSWVGGRWRYAYRNAQPAGTD